MMPTVGQSQLAPDMAYDVILVGGGLANMLIALRLAALRPNLKVALIERGPVIGGNHTWSCHATDLTPSQAAWMDPFMSYRWDSQRVDFPGFGRQLATGYRTMVSPDLAAHVAAVPGLDVLTNQTVATVTPESVGLESGQQLRSPLVIDGRGALREQPLALGFQKFYGLEVETRSPHGRREPVIMDATVPQLDGYRFVYTLPMTPTRILIEDTYYSDGSELSTSSLEQRVLAYAEAKGWDVASIVREERGILPIALAGDIDAHWSALGSEIPRVGLRAWLFHATTGYSLPYAVRVADEIAAAPTLTSVAIAQLTEKISRDEWDNQSFMRLLNRFLFVGARPAERVAVMARFYKLSEGLIQRFYAGRSTLRDKARVFFGRPPIPIGRALEVIPPQKAWDFSAARGEATVELG
ncbi:MAG: lycopene beta-cyclase CrtY [Pseudomonadota bacterium]